jgi:hypothetical protein
MEFCQGKGGAVAEIRKGVPVAAWDLPDQALASQLLQLVADTRRRRFCGSAPSR